jgi:hypothetical protein
MRLKTIIATLILMLIANFELKAGCGWYFTAFVNDTLVFKNADTYYGEGEAISLPSWVGKSYVICTQYPMDPDWKCSFVVYFQPGDTVNITPPYPNLHVTQPGIYVATEHQSECGTVYSFDCRYMSDSLEPYYLTHFDKHYSDSVKLAQQISNYLDSPSAVIYPNPVRNSLCIKDLFYQSTPVQISICDMNGRSLIIDNFDMPVGVQSKTIDLRMLEAGMYIVRYNNGEKQLVQRIVKM